MKQRKITIFGAGISGLTAAINLAENGFDVVVREKRHSVGGAPDWHPSVHQQVFDIGKTAEYVGVDIAGSFHAVKQHSFYFYDRKRVMDAPQNSYICEKGPQKTSIEHSLYTQAVRAGVDFAFGDMFTMKDIRSAKTESPECIIATGLELQTYRDLQIRHAVVHGYRALQVIKADVAISSFYGNYTNEEFAYLASSGELVFALLFSRKGMNSQNLQAFCNRIKETENVIFDNWCYSSGCVPMEKNLVKNGVVLAGTISGMIDPFYLNGISAALVSGKIASLYFMDKEKAVHDFDLFTRHFYRKQYLQSMSSRLPLKKYTFPFMSLLNGHLKCVGVL